MPFGRAWVDIATGAPVRLVFTAAGEASRQMIWDDQCAERSRLRHPLLNPLIDYGAINNDRLFEAYAARRHGRAHGRPRQPGAPARHTLSRVARSAAVGGPIARGASRYLGVVRASVEPDRTARRDARLRGPTLGIVLQPRVILDALREALDGAGVGGTTSLEISGGRGAGLRTAQLMSARIVRLAGFVPVASTSIVRLPSLRDTLHGRHVCVLPRQSRRSRARDCSPSFLASLGVASSRRHVLLRFSRSEAVPRGAQPLDGLGITAMTAMVFAGEDGPSCDELFDAARGAGGRPGLFLERLRATQVDQPGGRTAVVHESAPAYVLDSAGAPEPPRRQPGAPRRAERGARLAARGRHASAIRLLSRASRVLEAREEFALAASCAEALAWILRGRGHSELALEQFERVETLLRRLQGDRSVQRPNREVTALQAVIGRGIVWTDQYRFHQAEAALRAARRVRERPGVALSGRSRLPCFGALPLLAGSP